MAAAKRVRRVCPECGKGRLTPSRLRRIDVRRYCLPCSEKAGVLVETRAPALESKAEKAKAARAEREKRNRALAREGAARKKAATDRAFTTHDGCDTRDEVQVLWKIAQRHYPHLARRRAPEVRLGVRGGGSYAYTGRGFLTLGQPVDWYTLVHEVAHHVAPPVDVPGRKKRSSHHKAFYEAVKVMVETRLKGVTISWYPVSRWGYEVDGIVCRQIREQVGDARPWVKS